MAATTRRNQRTARGGASKPVALQIVGDARDELTESVAASEGFIPASVARAQSGQALRPEQMRLQRVQCPLKGYEHIAVIYRTNNKKWVARQLLMADTMPDGEAFINLLNKFVMDIEGWNFVREDEAGNPVPVPVPSAEHPDSWNWLADEMDDLMTFIIKDGYKKAKEQALGN